MPRRPAVITTPRLRLVPLDARLARLQLEDVVAFYTALGVRPCPSWPPPLYDRAAQAHSAETLAADPDGVGWYSWVFIGADPPLDPTLTDQVLIGAGGFHGRPDAQGIVEIGYAILPAHQCLGFAREAAGALIAWALKQRGVKAVRGRTMHDGHASQRVLLRLGFHPIPDDQPAIRAFLRRKARLKLPLTRPRRAAP
jgi:RimJ/RimL family protein N-acetyltransferase